ncbi:C69 family dipeptidase [Psychrobacter sp. JCM 18900]|uniref:C69 family dipeptidase n=1 Tax=Psychrobacter sp. JCM 18900 TaxID=1298608 RepID=UPI001918F4B3|nr:C69 family dipeptidase [Psychrobacter sp. JCM 18900]|tara:strand:+ start:2769 stop:4217 length:1449 start_codon:yes stop_codon:yes gene_type:complete
MCFSVIAGRNTTTTGCVIMGVNNDWPGSPGQVHHKPHKSYGSEDTFLTVKGIEIPQLPETFAYTYTVCDYETGTRHLSWADGMNENQVAVGMTGVYNFHNNQQDTDILEADDLSILILERGKTARQSIEMIGELIDQYGYTVSSIEGGSGAVTIAVADPNEGFFLEVVPGGLWVARKVNNDEVECRPNCFGTQEIDFLDDDTFMYSSHLRSYALASDLYHEGDTFNFSKIFGQGPIVSEAFGGTDKDVNRLRRYNCVHRLCELKHNPSLYIYKGKPSKKISILNMMDILRDTFEGTEYDLSKYQEAGMARNPLWMEVSHSIGQSGTVFSMVFEFKGNKRFSEADEMQEGCMWIAPAASKLSCFVPFYIVTSDIPHPYQIANTGDYDLDSAWWAFQEVGQLCYRNYDAIANKLVKPEFSKLQQTFFSEQLALNNNLATLDKDKCIDELANFTHDSATKAYKEALRLGKYIKGKYLSNTIVEWL